MQKMFSQQVPSTQGSNYGKYAPCNNQFYPNLCTKPSLWGASERMVGTLDYTADSLVLIIQHDSTYIGRENLVEDSVIPMTQTQ